MPPELPVTDLSDAERRRVLTDIAHWKLELELDESDAPYDEVEAYVRDLTDLSDKDLLERWYETVGEWALSRGADNPRTVDQNMWLDYQLGRLLQDRETDYGYVVAISIESFLATPKA
jgi:hypothetical protein